MPNIRSLYNVGSIFRTSDACDVEKIYLTGHTGRPDKEPKITKTALGAELNIPWEYAFQTARVIKQLKQDGYHILALENSRGSIDYREMKQLPAKVAIIVGNEVKGLSRTLLSQVDQTVNLPMMGKKESLNVSVAFGILAYFIKFQTYCS